jgi:hypothetical protein
MKRPISNNNNNNNNLTLCELHILRSNTTLDISNLEDLTDYKKLSLQKLRSIVSEKGLSEDVSKFNKNKLLKLLGVE